MRYSGDSRAIAHILAGLASMIGLLGQPERGVRLSAAAAVLFDAIGVSLWPIDKLDYERNLAAIRERLGEQAFNAACRRGDRYLSTRQSRRRWQPGKVRVRGASGKNPIA